MYIYIYIYIYMIEGSSEVKLPTIWTDGKAQAGTLCRFEPKGHESQ